MLKGRYGFGWMLVGWIAVAVLLIGCVVLGLALVLAFPLNLF
jgi:hypothetical protein